VQVLWPLALLLTHFLFTHVLTTSADSQVTAHARWTNAIDMHPTKDIFATAAEDCIVSVRQ